MARTISPTTRSNATTRRRAARVPLTEVELGPLAKSLTVQLRGHLPRAEAARLECCRTAIMVLRGYQVLTRAQANTARDRLFKSICTSLKEQQT